MTPPYHLPLTPPLSPWRLKQPPHRPYNSIPKITRSFWSRHPLHSQNMPSPFSTMSGWHKRKGMQYTISIDSAPMQTCKWHTTSMCVMRHCRGTINSIRDWPRRLDRATFHLSRAQTCVQFMLHFKKLTKVFEPPIEDGNNLVVALTPETIAIALSSDFKRKREFWSSD